MTRFVKRNDEIVNEKDVLDMAFANKISEQLAMLLIQRGINTEELVEKFLYPKISDFHDPLLLPDMCRTVDIINNAISSGDKICIYGDYDVDGVSSTSILYKTLQHLSADVFYYIPRRHDEGYGLNMEAIDKVKARGADVLLTVDCGISSVDEVAHAKELGLTVIITDHHQCPDILPSADCIISAKRVDNIYPFDDLCGGGVAFKLSQALVGITKSLDFIDLAALATVADIVPLVDENRLITKLGLEKMNRQPSLGISCLMEVASLKGKEINAGHLGFQIGPRINAGGRMDSSLKSVDMLVTQDRSIALSIANELNDDNESRKTETDRVIREAIAKVESEIDFSKDMAIVCWKSDWNLGVLGIAASKLVEKYNRPAILISMSEDGWHGSGRSISGLNLHQAIKLASGHLLGFGGHPMAAGLSIAEDELESFKTAFLDAVDSLLDRELLLPKLNYDNKLELGDITKRFVGELELMTPTGMGNPKPLFMVEDIGTVNTKRMGRNNAHFRCDLVANNTRLKAVGFSMESPNANSSYELIIEPQINRYNGYENVQGIIKQYKQNFAPKELSVTSENVYIDNFLENISKPRKLISTFLHEDSIPSDMLSDGFGTAILVNTPKEAERLLNMLVSKDALDSFSHYKNTVSGTVPGENVILLSADINADSIIGYNNVILIGEYYCDELLGSLFGDLPKDRFTVIIDKQSKEAVLDLLSNQNLTRDDFTAVYKTVLKTYKSGRFIKDKAALLNDIVKSCGLNIGLIHIILEVFTELGFFALNQENPVIVMNSTEKKSLDSSRLYQESVMLKIIS